MEHEQIENEIPSYWNSVLIGALIVAILSSVAGTILLYYVAGTEPSMSLLIVSSLFVPVTCLVGLVGGLISTRHYAKTNDVTFPIGKGALIGLLTGVLAAVFSSVISLIWTQLIDPSLMEAFTNNMISAMESVEMPQAQREQSINGMMENKEKQNSAGGILTSLAINAGILGVVNAITGMIGAKLFASEKEEFAA